MTGGPVLCSQSGQSAYTWPIVPVNRGLGELLNVGVEDTQT